MQKKQVRWVFLMQSFEHNLIRAENYVQSCDDHDVNHFNPQKTRNVVGSISAESMYTES